MVNLIRVFTGLLAAALVVALTPVTRADNLDRELIKQGPKVIKYLIDEGYAGKNVGVLKFLVRKGDQADSDSVGPLNLTVARRLEIALALATGDDEQAQVNLIRDASSVAAGINGADHLSAAGRKALFQGQYQPAWGEQRTVVADAFLTGRVEITPDMKEASVIVQAFDREDDELKQVARFTAETDATTFAEAGESFLLRGLLDGGKLQVNAAQVADATVKVQKNTAKEYPLLVSQKPPLYFGVFYDRKPVPLEFKDGKALIPTPLVGQKVQFLVRRLGTSRERFGIVVMLNGENTHNNERQPPLGCSKYILDPDEKEFVLSGYRGGADGTEVRAFQVLPPRESKENSVHYGSDVGQISFMVYRELQTPDQAPADVKVVRQGKFPPKLPKDAVALKTELRGLAEEQTVRGLIVPGPGIAAAKLREVTFTPDPNPVMSATISYYRP